MNPQDWEPVSRLLAQPQDLSAVVPGDELVIYVQDTFHPKERFFLQKMVRVTEEGYLSNGSTYPYLYNRKGESCSGGFARAFLPCPELLAAVAWYEKHLDLRNVFEHRKGYASVALLEQIYTLLLTFPSPNERLDPAPIKLRKFKVMTIEQIKEANAWARRKHDFSRLRTGQRVFWWCDRYIVPVKITRTTKKHVFLRLPLEACNSYRSHCYSIGRNELDRKIMRNGQDRKYVGITGPAGILPWRWELDALYYNHSLFYATGVLFVNRFSFSQLITEEQLAAMEQLILALPTARQPDSVMKQR